MLLDYLGVGCLNQSVDVEHVRTDVNRCEQADDVRAPLVEEDVLVEQTTDGADRLEATSHGIDQVAAHLQVAEGRFMKLNMAGHCTKGTKKQWKKMNDARRTLHQRHKEVTKEKERHAH
jgi:hypothetical protein